MSGWRAWTCILLLASACSDPNGTPSPPAPSAAASLDLSGIPLDPLTHGDGPATVLLFVSTHCPISNRYALTIRALADRFATHDITAWLVYPDPSDTPEKIRTHTSEFSLPTRALRDPSHALVTVAGATVTPEAAVFARGSAKPAYVGRIDDRVVEFGKVRASATRFELRDAVDNVLQGRPPVAAGGPAIGCYISDLR